MAFRDYVQDRLFAAGGDSARLFRDQCKWVRLVEQAQLATRVTFRWRIQKHTALQERSVEIGDQGTDVARAIGRSASGDRSA